MKVSAGGDQDAHRGGRQRFVGIEAGILNLDEHLYLFIFLFNLFFICLFKSTSTRTSSFDLKKTPSRVSGRPFSFVESERRRRRKKRRSGQSHFCRWKEAELLLRVHFHL